MHASGISSADRTPIVFGTDGWRGVMGDDVTETSVARAAQAFASYCGQKGWTRGVAIGYDGRASSDEFAALFDRVLTGNGIPVVRSDAVVPTPVISYTVRARGLNAGVVLTASHNPPRYNGVKFKEATGAPFHTEETHRVEQLVDRTAVRMAAGQGRVEDLLGPYLVHLEQLIRFEEIRASGIRVFVDSMHGAGGMILERLLKRHGIVCGTVAGDLRSDFGGRNPEPIERNLRPLAEALRAGSAGVGIATDGDADRLGVLLEDGRWLSAQETILLLVDHVLTTRQVAGDVVKTASVTDKVHALAGRHRRKVHEVQVGFKYVSELMTAGPVAVGCEESGGYGFGDHLPDRDGVYSALLVLEALAKSGFTRAGGLVAARRARDGEVHYDRIDLEHDVPDRMSLLPRLTEARLERVAGFTVREVRTFASSRGVINGIKFILEGHSRWLLLRASETEPLVRFYAEGRSDAEVQGLLQEGRERLLRL